MSEGTKDLELLVGEHAAVTVVVNGEEHLIPIRQIKTGKVPKLLRAAGPLMEALSNKKKALNISELFMFYTDDFLNMLAVLIDRPRDFVDELEVEDSVKLITECLEVNVDFFVQRILPLLSSGVLQVLGGLAKNKALQDRLAGSRPPSTSSPKDTTSEESGNTNTESSLATSAP